MSIFICRASEVQQLAQEKNIKNILSVEHPGAEDGKGRAPRIEGANQKILSFWDVEEANVPNGPSKDVVIEGLNFIDQCGSEDIIVHCHAGKARSVGLALAWLANKHNIDEAIDAVKEARPQLAPNIEVIRIADELYNMGGKLEAAVRVDPLISENREKANIRREEQIEEFYKLHPEKRLVKKRKIDSSDEPSISADDGFEAPGF